MKKFTNKIVYLSAVSFALLFFSLSCTKVSNIDQKLITDKMLEQDANQGGFLLPGMMKNILQVDQPWNYEFQQNLNL